MILPPTVGIFGIIALSCVCRCVCSYTADTFVMFRLAMYKKTHSTRLRLQYPNSVCRSGLYLYMPYHYILLFEICITLSSLQETTYSRSYCKPC